VASEVDESWWRGDVGHRPADLRRVGAPAPGRDVPRPAVGGGGLETTASRPSAGRGTSLGRSSASSTGAARPCRSRPVSTAAAAPSSTPRP